MLIYISKKIYFTRPYPLFNVEPFHPLIILSSRHPPPLLFLFPLLLSLLPRESFPRHTTLASSSRLRSLHSISSLCLFSLPPHHHLSVSPLCLALVFHSCCSKTSRHALLKPVVFFLFFPPLLFSTLITAIKTSTPLMLRLPTPTSSCSECALN